MGKICSVSNLYTVRRYAFCLLVVALNQHYVGCMIWIGKIRRFSRMIGMAATLVAMQLFMGMNAYSQEVSSPSKANDLKRALNASQWQELENGLQVIKAMTEEGVVMTAFRISPDEYSFSVTLQDNQSGSRAKQIGESEGAVVVVNAGFFATTEDSVLYSVGYLRLNGKTLSKGWDAAGGTVSIKDSGLELKPTYEGLPEGKFDVLQSKPMLIEPGGIWAMGSNSGSPKPRTILCKLNDGNIILAAITRFGLTLFEAGWLMRAKEEGGFFGCDSALAFDGGRSTQIWYSGDEKYSSSGISPVHNFFVVRQKED